jgi:hypothetical protein
MLDLLEAEALRAAGFLSRLFSRLHAGLGRALGVLARRVRTALRAGLARVARLRGLGRELACIALLGGSLWLAIGQLLFEVPPGYVAVRRSNLGGGIAARDFGPGLHWKRPGIDSWSLAPKAPHWVRFGLGEPAKLDLRTRDDNPAALDVAVLYRVSPGQFHRLLAAGLGDSLEDRVRATAEDVLRSALATLESEQWFETDARQQVAAAALEPLQSALAPLFCEPIDVLISQVTFSKEFEQKLQEKRLDFQAKRRAEAQLSVDSAKKELEEAQRVTTRGVAESASRWAKRLAERRATAALDIAALLADSREQIAARAAAAEGAFSLALAEGQRALSEAQAGQQFDLLEALAMPGGESFLAAEAARSLRLETLRYDPSKSGAPLPLDLAAWQALLTPTTPPR